MKITDKCPKCGQQLQGKLLHTINILAISCENCEYHAAINVKPEPINNTPTQYEGGTREF